MYRQGYAEIMDDSGAAVRMTERQAFERAIDMLAGAEKEGARSQQTAEALAYVGRLWTLLMQDLAKPDNDLPEQIRAGLISTGIWVLKETDRIRTRESDDLPALREIHEIIVQGLE